ncbi:sodium- and chloride-dependent betaine transporter-like [Biomphalaria glabrata]|uniref:Sodium- and chloride-dependent betaine transporter-like n=1 Tax=Biomphalaria glabrata TaxID=6526 RepID=A0A9W2ZCH0_BIOGL|nr:sodium- and chloride-dependent betaine transporter-like [Biomphalaria glabrata]XP_055872588.1 sodium- and chloride-dependent betaine transporter-like [Biomphalaria glabrata]XP_055872589.1 sodium- and chloride-dependent betaine transporter-like [Biomphalaria glabrata]XP_055872590.1 sodium- and chloride-dependent betaine transporter-like [Biomphalaria glabrata]XP_055872591.1 sodium- and chloride-dependent betaine transporter-like [Biomphalaria glabrata]
MSLDIPSWNIVEFVVICFYSCYLSFIYAPEGGLTVVAVYVPLVLLGVPAVFVQLKLGGYLQRGLVGVFSLFFPFWKGVGIAALFDLLLQLSTLAPLVAQLGTYAFIAISKEDYIWGNCENMNYQETCDPQGVSMSRPANIFYKQAFLQVSSDIQNINGFPQWQFTDLARKAGISLMPVTLAIVWVLVTLFVGFGARVCGWILFLLAPAALSCLLTVLGYGYHHLNNTHTVDYLKTLYMFHESEGDVLEKWLKGFKLLIYTFPMWTPICCTMGKFCGKSQRIRNMTWIALVAIFVLVSQLPNLAMAPYLGNLLNSGQHFSIASDISRIMIQMPEAFTTFKIPHAYGFVFYLSAFLLTLMFLCIGTLTIVDNIVESLRHWIDKHTCSKIAVHLLITFLVMLVAMGLGIIQTTKAGHYYYLLFTQSFDKLRFLIIILIAFGLMIVYVKQNFGLIERIVMGFWFTISALISSGLWLYHLYIQLDFHSTNIQLDDITKSKEELNYLPQEWTWVSWAIAGFPFIGILLGAIHACFSACKDSSQKCRKLCCGMTERIREQNGDDFSPPPLHPSEPSAPPYMYSYIDRSMNGTHRHEDYDLDHYKLDYDPPETEPLTRNNRSTRI